MDKKLNIKVWYFAIVSGCFLLSSNAINFIIPLRMIDQGLSYSEIGSVIASFSLGLISIKLLIGRLSDIKGMKIYMIFSFISFAILALIMTKATTTLHYIILLCLIGIARGIFTSVNSAYIYEISEKEDMGKGFGKVLGISSLFTTIGGVMAGALYKWNSGVIAFYIISILLIVSTIVIWRKLPDSNTNENGNKTFSKEIIMNMDKRLILLCFVVFLQTMVTSPMWNMIIPIYFYKTFAYSAFSLGIVMSLDELIGSPVYLVGGYIADKLSIRKMNCGSFIFAGIVGLSLLVVKTSIAFLILFLVCSVFVTGTYIGLPKAEAEYVRPAYKGIEFALISISASIGDALGNVILGNIIEKYGIQSGILVFVFTYSVIVILLFVGLRKRRKNNGC